jgi:putative DNA primase/helicase
VLGPGQTIPIELLYQAWRLWCDKVGRKPGTKQIFGRDLRAAVPGLKITHPRDGDSRERKYEGIGLKQR